jgi:site-specific DNA recombinase
LAKRERCTVRQVNLTPSLAFLAPQLVKSAVEGRLPRGINIERLRIWTHPGAGNLRHSA